MRKFLDWLMDHGMGLALTFLVMLLSAIFTTISIVIVLFLNWWDKIK